MALNKSFERHLHLKYYILKEFPLVNSVAFTSKEPLYSHIRSINYKPHATLPGVKAAFQDPRTL